MILLFTIFFLLYAHSLSDMWIIGVFKAKEYSLLLNSLEHQLKNNRFYKPSFNFNGKNQNLLGNYCFIYNSDFTAEKLKSIRYVKGLNYILQSSLYFQTEIKNFINNLKQFEDNTGVIQSDYFYQYLNQQGKFFKGPLKNLVFEVLEKKNKILKVSIEGWNFPITINNPKLSVVGILQ